MQTQALKGCMALLERGEGSLLPLKWYPQIPLEDMRLCNSKFRRVCEAVWRCRHGHKHTSHAVGLCIVILFSPPELLALLRKFRKAVVICLLL